MEHTAEIFKRILEMVVKTNEVAYSAPTNAWDDTYGQKAVTEDAAKLFARCRRLVLGRAWPLSARWSRR